MSQIKILLFSLFLVGLTFQLYAQTTIWEENFDSYPNGTTSSSKWTISNNQGVCQVANDPYQSGNKVLEANHVNQSATWKTNSIDISGKGLVSISIDLSKNGALENSGPYLDYIRCEYKVDNGSWTTFSSNGNLVGNFNSTKAYSSGISGNNLIIRVTFHNTASNEYYFIDNVSVSIPGKILWLKADAGVNQSGAQVAAWQDQSGNGNNATPPNNYNEPTFHANHLNFNPSVEFIENSYPDYLTVASNNTLNPSKFTVFSVFTPGNNTGIYDAIISKQLYNNNGYSLQYYPNQNNLITVLNPNFTNQYIYSDRSSSISTTGNAHILGGLFDGTQITTFSNDVENSFTYSNPITPNTYDLLIGKDYNGQNPDYLDGNLCEVIMYNEALSQTEQDEVKSYLALKYGITLTTNNYISHGGSVIYNRSSYGNDIAGIGYDSQWGLDQKVSSSVNTSNTQSSDVTIATTADFTSSNQNTSRTSLTDGQYLIWGDNNGQTTTWSTDGSYQRVGRWWKIQNTGSVGEVHLQINLNSYPALPASNSYALIVDNNGNLSDGGVDNVFPLSTSGNNLYTTTVTFPPGTHYFTIEAIQPLSLSTSVNKNVSCNSGNDGEISASATGGSGSYTFYLNNVETTFPASNLAAGTYNVKVTSGSETKSQTLTITEPGKLMNTLPDITNVKCKGDHTGAVDIHIPYPVKFSSASNDYIDLGGSFLNGVSSFTMEGWIKFNKADLAGLTRIGLFGQNDIIEFGFSNSTTIQFWTAHGGSCSVPLSQYPDDNGWHHIAAVGTGSQIIVYIDGVQAGNIHYTTSSYGSSSFDVTIGGYVYDPIGSSSSHSFPGEIRKVGFWNRALSQVEIQNIVASNNDYSGSQSNLLAGYNFFEGTGNKITPVGSTTTSGTFGNSTTWDINAYTFKWSKSGTQIATTEDLSGISAGDYSLSVTSTDGCEQAETYSVTEPSSGMNITLSASPPTHAECVGTPVSFSTNVSGGTSPFNYDFMIDASSAQSGTQTTYTYNTLAGNKNVTVMVTDASGCTSTSAGYSIDGSNTPTTGVITKN